MALAKPKLRTSEEVFKRLRFAVQWDEDSVYYGEQDIWIGYEDGIYGPMEQRLSAFVPIDKGGDLPFHSIWYFRCGGRVVWDRRRRMDELWLSGETEAIHIGRAGKADAQAAQETAAAMAKAALTMAALEEERQIRLAVQQQKKRQQLRAQKIQEKARSDRLLAPCPVSTEQVAVHVVGGCASKVGSRTGLNVLTWNALDDSHADAYPPGAHSTARAAGLAMAICAAEPDIVAMQEATQSVIAALDEAWPNGCWRTDALEELVVWSRYPIIRALSVSLGQNTSKQALLMEVAVQRRAVALACVHLTSDFHGNNSAKRVMQAQIVRDALAGHMPQSSYVVCGDFNEPSPEGVEAAVACMQELTDIWPAVHGGGNPGFTFDPTRSHLAQLGAICEDPRRLDRIFASPGLLPQDCSLLGVGSELSDHYGVIANFKFASSLGMQPVNTSAATLLPPRALWSQIDSFRERFDPSFGRWMPHINLIYGFLPEAEFTEAATAIEPTSRCHEPLEIRLEEITVFEHGRSASLVIVPSCSPAGGIEDLQRDLQALFPACASRDSGFKPHLTLGKFDSAEEARHWKVELERAWAPLSFVALEVSLIARVDDQPFGVRSRVPLGFASSHADVATLEALEAASGCQAFAVGSAALLGAKRPRDSDLDVLLVGLRSREDVFDGLSASMSAAWVRRASGQFPLLQMEFRSMELDIQYACTERTEHPIHWPEARCVEGGTAAAALRDVHTLRAALLEACGLDGWRLYQGALLKVKQWAKRRHIDKNALGYIGGFSWSLLLADTLLHRQSQSVAGLACDSPAALVTAMCARFARWAWPKPVTLGGRACIANADRSLMPILCPSDPYANSARNVTVSSMTTITSELEFAASGSGCKAAPLLTNCVGFVVCRVVAADLVDLRRAARWLEARLLLLVRCLDHLGARPLSLGHGLYVVGASVVKEDLRHFAFQFQERLSRDDTEGWCEVIEVAVEDTDAVQGRLRRASPTP